MLIDITTFITNCINFKLFRTHFSKKAHQSPLQSLHRTCTSRQVRRKCSSLLNLKYTYLIRNAPHKTPARALQISRQQRLPHFNVINRPNSRKNFPGKGGKSKSHLGFSNFTELWFWNESVSPRDERENGGEAAWTGGGADVDRAVHT